jgi:hypothetical protein
LPAQGAGTVFDTLNVHTAASRTSPSFLQIEEGDQIEVVAHRVTEREGTESPADDWFLVRTQEGRAGWVLSRMVLMTIPDEVAQYANGHYITAYQPLDDQGTSWLWTTSERGRQSFDFDGLRVFVYNPRRGAYDTVFSLGKIKGYYPLERSGDTFSAVLEEKDGSLAKRTYTFNGSKVKFLDKEPYQLSRALPELGVPKSFDTTAPPEDSWADKVRGFAEWWFGI